MAVTLATLPGVDLTWACVLPFSPPPLQNEHNAHPWGEKARFGRAVRHAGAWWLPPGARPALSPALPPAQRREEERANPNPHPHPHPHPHLNPHPNQVPCPERTYANTTDREAIYSPTTDPASLELRLGLGLGLGLGSRSGLGFGWPAAPEARARSEPARSTWG